MMWTAPAARLRIDGGRRRVSLDTEGYNPVETEVHAAQAFRSYDAHEAIAATMLTPMSRAHWRAVPALNSSPAAKSFTIFSSHTVRHFF